VPEAQWIAFFNRLQIHWIFRPKVGGLKSRYVPYEPSFFVPAQRDFRPAMFFAHS
jgi:hypothetical protein